MTRVAPQWVAAMSIVHSGRLGTLRACSASFSYFNDDPANVRNVARFGGGALLDIGCYLVNTARMVFGREPERVSAYMDIDPRFGIDRTCTMLMNFGDAQAEGICATQMAPHQRVQIFGDRARLDIEVPFNAPIDRPCRLTLHHGVDMTTTEAEPIDVPTSNQYTVQGDLVSRAILNGTAAPYPLEDSLLNMRVIDALFRSASEHCSVGVL